MKNIASIDIGLKRIGIALYLNGIIIPQTPILRKNRIQAANDVTSFLKNHNINILIVGLPKNGSSSEEMKRRIEHFISLLTYEGQIFYEDEYGSSQEAKKLMSCKDKRDGKLDSICALIILERWLEKAK